MRTQNCLPLREHSPPVYPFFLLILKSTSMKKHTLAFLLILCLHSAHSQLTKGIWLAGGTGKFYSYTCQYSSTAYSNEASYTQIDLSPNVGYFIADKLAFGLRPTFSSLKGKVTTPGGIATNVQRYWIGPVGRYYLLEEGKQTNIVMDVSYQFGTLGGISKGSLSSFSAMAGPVIFFNSSVGLEFLLGYSRSKDDVEGYQKQINSGFQIAAAFQVHLEK
jgi:hypothetical protein